jgi:hypothetical protein
MKWFIGLTVVTVLIALYVTVVRPWMRQTVWGKWMLDKIEPFERTIFNNSESILWARFLAFLGSLLTLLVQIGQIDLSPIAPLLPEGWRWIPQAAPMVLFVAGIIQERLRRDTTKPLEIVSMRTDAPLEVKIMAEEADVLNKKAAEVVAASDKAADSGVVP